MITGKKSVYPTTGKRQLNDNSSEFTVGQYGGLNIREHFAAIAMQGFVTKRVPHELMDKPWVEWVSEISVEMADALIKELNKTTTP